MMIADHLFDRDKCYVLTTKIKSVSYPPSSEQLKEMASTHPAKVVASFGWSGLHVPDLIPLDGKAQLQRESTPSFGKCAWLCQQL